MFEALMLVCAMGAPQVCRDTLLPGFEAPDEAGCAAALAADPPAPPAFGAVRGAPFCRETGPALPFDEVAPGLFVHVATVAEWDGENRGDVGNIAFVVGGTGVAVIDAGSARWMGEGVWRAIRARTGLPVTHLVLTHMHPDHVLGAGPLIEAGARVVGHPALTRAIEDRAESYLGALETILGPEIAMGAALPVVDLPVEGTRAIDLGGRTLDVRTWPASHTGTDATVLDSQSGILLAGDLVFDRHVPALDGSLRGWQSVLGALSELDVAGVVPGHGGPRLDWPGGAVPQATYLDDLAEDVGAAIARGARLSDVVEEAARETSDVWELFPAFHPRNATVAFTELEWE